MTRQIPTALQLNSMLYAAAKMVVRSDGSYSKLIDYSKDVQYQVRMRGLLGFG